MFLTEFVGNIETHILCSIPFPHSRAVGEIMWKNAVELDTPRMTCNTAHAHFILGTWGYRHVVRIFNTCCFSTAVFTRPLLSVTFMRTFIVLLFIDSDGVEK